MRRVLLIGLVFVLGCAVGWVTRGEKGDSPRNADALAATDPVAVEVTNGPQGSRVKTPLTVKVIDRPDGSQVVLDRDWSAPDGSWWYLALTDSDGRTTILHCAVTAAP
jgi:hypothetical protein